MSGDDQLVQEQEDSHNHLPALNREPVQHEQGQRSLSTIIKHFVMSERILTILIHIFYAIPPHWPRGLTWHRIPNLAMIPSIIVAILLWVAFGMEMSIINILWSQAQQQNHHTPLGSILLVVLITLSSTVSYTILVFYWYNPRNRFRYSSSKLIPGFQFVPLGTEEDITPNRKDWMCVNLFLVFAFVGLGFALYNALGPSIIFGFTDLHKFTSSVTKLEKAFYFSALAILNWGHVSSILACSVFYIVCRNITRHIDFTEELLVSRASDFNSAKNFHECLLNYTAKTSRSLIPWFVVHSGLFGLIVLLTLLDLLSTLQSPTTGNISKEVWLSEVTASWLVSIQFAFPFFSASLVTRRFEKMYDKINRDLTNLESFQAVDAFLNYCIRCNSGFHVLGIKITTSLAVVSIGSVFVGLFRFYKDLF